MIGTHVRAGIVGFVAVGVVGLGVGRSGHAQTSSAADAPPAAEMTVDGDTAPPAPAATADDWSVGLRLGAWVPRLKGDSSIAPGAPIDFDTELDLAGSEAVFNGELTLQVPGRWQLRATGFTFSTDRATVYAAAPATFGAVSLAAGDAYQVSLDLTSFAVEAGYQLWRPIRPEGGDGTRLDFSPLGGVRYLHVSQLVAASGGPRQRETADWGGVYGGLEMQARWEPAGGLPGFGHALLIDGMIGVGAILNRDQGVFWEVRAGITWELTRHVGLMFGYRLLEIDADDGDYTFDAGLQGLYLALALRF